MAGDIERRRFMAAAGGTGLSALVRSASARPSAPAAAADPEALHREALELVLQELEKTPATARESLLKLLDLLIRYG